MTKAKNRLGKDKPGFVPEIVRFTVNNDPRAIAKASRKPHHANYLAMFSSVHGSIVTKPELMCVPLDDHLVHRGDGVFEVMKCVAGSIYNLKAHLLRLERSAKSIFLDIEPMMRWIPEAIIATVKAGGEPDAQIHIYASRGPGGLSANPFESVGCEFYAIAIKLRKPFMETHPEGARGRKSAIPPKPPFFARIKSCNYLPNVLMKREAVEWGVDFTVAFDSRGFMGEGATENIGIVTKDNRLVFPETEGTLAGTTMIRTIELAQKLVKNGKLRSAGFGNVKMKDINSAREMLVVGTTWNVSAAVEFEGRRIGDGKPGQIQQMLDSMLARDILTSKKLRTPVFV